MARRWVRLTALALAVGCQAPPPTGPSTGLLPAGPTAAIGTDWATVAVLSRTDLGTLGGASSYSTDVNNRGTVVGWSQNANGIVRAFRWTVTHGMTDLGTLPGDEWSRAYRIRNDGQILGVSGASTHPATPVVWSRSGSIAALPIPLLPNAAFGYPTDFNLQGDVVGWDVVVLQHAWAWTQAQGKYDITASIPGGFEGVASQVNALGLVVGTDHARTCVRSPECWHAFLWRAETGYRDLGTPGADTNTMVTGNSLNDAGTVVGWTSTPDTGLRPYRWSEEEGFTLLPALSYGYALSINSRNTAVGASEDPAYGAIQADAWPAGGGMIKLSPDDPYPQVAVAINDRGVVAGWSSKDCCGGENHATLWVLGPANAVVTANVGRVSVPSRLGGAASGPVARVATSGTVACLSDARALTSRGALFACVAKGEAKL